MDGRQAECCWISLVIDRSMVHLAWGRHIVWVDQMKTLSVAAFV